jgi:hypothetical protein
LRKPARPFSALPSWRQLGRIGGVMGTVDRDSVVIQAVVAATDPRNPALYGRLDRDPVTGLAVIRGVLRPPYRAG